MQLNFSMMDVIGVLPEIIIAAAACLLLMVDLLVPKNKKNLIGYLAIAFVIVAGIYTYYLVGVNGSVMAGMYSVDAYGAFFKFIFYIATILTIMLSFNYIKVENMESRGEYYTLMLFSLCGMMIMASGADLLTIYLGIELMALPIYVLVGYFRTDKRSNEAAMKYIILGALSSGILLYGISLIYGVTGTTNLVGISTALTGANASNMPLFLLGLVLLSSGLCFKLAGFPFHIWAPDAYEGAPTSITAFMTVGAKAAGFAAATRIFIEALMPAYDEWHIILIVVAVLSMGYGNIVAIMQTNIKRMLAYSSIGHAGYAMLGIIAGSGEGTSAVLFYMLAYVFMNMGIFGVIILMRKGKVSGDDISHYKGFAKKHRLLALVMLIFLFSLAGIPPTAGFMGKFFIFMTLINQGMIALAVYALLTSAIAAFFYIRIVMYMYMREPEGEFEMSRSRPVYYVLGIAIIGVVVLGVYPGLFVALAQKAALIL
jgi:NADH-quinone oxidoreductase subunit N